METKLLTIAELKAMKPSARIRFALAALEEMENAPGWSVKMTYYHDYEAIGDQTMCFGCLGGAAAIKALRPAGFTRPLVIVDGIATIGQFINLLQSETETLFTPEERSEIRSFETALNAAREGFIHHMLQKCGINTPPPGLKEAIHIPSYHTDRQGFIVEMNALAELLERYQL